MTPRLLGKVMALPVFGGAGTAFASVLLFGGTFAGISALTLSFAGLLARRRSAGLVGMLTTVYCLGPIIWPRLAGIMAGQTQSFLHPLVAMLVAAGGLLMAPLQPFVPC